MKPAFTIALSGITALVVSSAVFVAAPYLIDRSEGVQDMTIRTTPSDTSDLISMVQRTEPAVVSVIVTKDLPVIERFDSSVESPFGIFSFPEYRQNGTAPREVGGGTAFFISENGMLMTNKHVVNDTEAQYTVLLNDGRKLSAKVLAIDPGSDIALLKVDGNNFPSLTFSDEEPVLAEQVVAIGNALGEFRNTVSVGVVSGLSRSIVAGSRLGGGTEELSRIIQTDAAINEGNSGGPLLNANGEVIGMNTAIASNAQNIGFAIPSHDLTKALESFEKNGKILRPFIGVRYMLIDKTVQAQNSLDYDYGALVVKGDTAADLAVIPGSPADKAGIKENDILLELDGKKISVDTSLASLIREKSVGDTVTIKLSRGGTETEVKVTLEAQK